MKRADWASLVNVKVLTRDIGGGGGGADEDVSCSCGDCGSGDEAGGSTRQLEN